MKGIRCYFYILLGIILSIFPFSTVNAWFHNNGILVNSGFSFDAMSVPDSAGGAIITWTGNGPMVAQRISSYGNFLWSVSGVTIGTGASVGEGDQGNFQNWMISDGSGGAIRVVNYTNPEWCIYVQRINGNGTVLWSSQGVSVSTTTYTQFFPAVASDGSGGAIVTWSDYRNTTSNLSQSWDLYAQRINNAGIPQWGSSGISICTAINDQIYPNVIEDNAGGAYIVWEDMRDGTRQIYMQHVNSTGSTLWTSNGIPVVTGDVSNKNNPKVISDQTGGVIVSWIGQDIHAQRIDTNGNLLWGTSGSWIGPHFIFDSDFHDSPLMCQDTSGGAIIAWRNNVAIFAQRVNSNGSTLWQTNGLTICTAAGSIDWDCRLTPDGVDGALLAWNSYWPSTTASPNRDVYTQRINSVGSTLWDNNGVAICTAQGFQYFVYVVNDGAGGAIVNWYDQENPNQGLYIQHVTSTGRLGDPLAIPKQYWESFTSDKP